MTVAYGYVAAMILLGWHLDHGIWSMLRTMGLGHPSAIRWSKIAAAAISIITVLGYIAIPLAVQWGVLR